MSKTKSGADRVQREKSYRPPFSGAHSQPVQEFRKIHWRWAAHLATKLPDGVPQQPGTWRCAVCETPVTEERTWRHDFPEQETLRRWNGTGWDAVPPHDPQPYFHEPIWPATFGDWDDANERPIHRTDEGHGYCFQCGFCQYYVCLESALGADWGACTNAASEYDGRVVFEHWTCKAFRQ